MQAAIESYDEEFDWVFGDLAQLKKRFASDVEMVNGYLSKMKALAE